MTVPAADARGGGMPPRAAVSRRYYKRRLRSLSVGDVVAVGEVALAVGRPAGWQPVRGGLNEVRIDEHGTHPLPVSSRSSHRTAPCRPGKEGGNTHEPRI